MKTRVPVDALDPLAIHVRALPPEQPVRAAIAPARFEDRQRLELRAELRVVARGVIALRRACEAEEATRAPLGDADGGHSLLDRAPPRCCGPHGFPRRSFNTWMLSAWSATTRLSRDRKSVVEGTR